jgi:hypothetical protein
MRLTWRDGVTTVLAVAVVLATMAVVEEWGWPLLGSYRAGGVVLLVLGFGMCALSGSSQTTSMRSPYTVTTSILGVLALGFAIWAIIADTQAPFVALAIDIVLLWLVSTMHHAIGSPGRREPALGAR